MTLETIRSLLLWSMIINYAIVTVWFLVFLVARQRIYSIWRRWFRMTDEQFEVAMFTSMSLYKVGVLLLNVAPLAALTIVGN